MISIEKPSNVFQWCEMAVTKKNNKYYIVLYKKGGKQEWIPTGCGDRQKALAMERELRQAKYKSRLKEHSLAYLMNAAESISQEYQPAGASCETIWERYVALSETKKLAARTISSKRIIWNNFSKWLKEREISYLQQVTRKTAQEYMNEKGGTGQTFNNIRNSLSSIIKAVRIIADLPENPFEAVPTQKRIEHKSYRPFTDDELKTIFEKVTGEWHLACTFARYTGLRFTSVAHIRWINIDNANGIINLRPEKTIRYGIRAIIPIHKTLQAALSRIADNNSEFIMPGLAANYSEKEQQAYFGELLRGLKIVDSSEGKVGFHSFRHTFNTKLEQADIESAVRQKLSGHSSVETNMIYSHALDPMRKAIDKLD